MSLYTFIMDYKGGTYLSQVNTENSLKDACFNWANQLKPSEIVGFGEKTKVKLIEQIQDKEIVPIKNLLNVWCLSFLIRNNLVLITVIQTVEKEAIQNPKSEI